MAGKIQHNITAQEAKAALKESCGSMGGAAAILGIGRTTFYGVLERLGLSPDQFRQYSSRAVMPREDLSSLQAENEKLKRKLATALKKPIIDKPVGKKHGGKVVDKLLICPDTHSQFIDMSAFQVLLDFKADWKPTKTVHLGDLLDCEGISSFPKDDALPMKEEFEIGRHHLDLLQPTHLHFGNHEERVERPGAINPSIQSLVDVADNLDLDARGIKYKPYGAYELFEWGKLKTHHGKYCTDNAAKAHAQAYGCVAFGHTHRIQSYTAREVSHAQTGFNVGTMTSISLGYSKFVTGWAQGFAFAYIFADGDFSFYQVRLIGNEFVIQDKYYQRDMSIASPSI